MGYAAVADPDEVLVQIYHGDSPDNWGRFSDPVVDELFEQQKVERDEKKRIQLAKDLQKRIIEKTLWLPGPVVDASSRCGRRTSATTNRCPAIG